MFERVHLVPGENAQVPLATNVAANLTAKKKIQGWHVAPDGIGITIDLYGKNSGIVADYKGYELYRVYIVGEFELVGMAEKTAHRRVVSDGADTDALVHSKPATAAPGVTEGTSASSGHGRHAKPRNEPKQRRELAPDSGVEYDSRSTETDEAE